MSRSQALATGKTDDVAAVATEIERASLAMQLAVQVQEQGASSLPRALPDAGVTARELSRRSARLRTTTATRRK